MKIKESYTDKEMTEFLEEIGYTVDDDCLSDLAIFEGFNWSDVDELWIR